MAGVTCAGCTTVYAVGVAKCPQCGSSERAERAGGTVLPSVTVACGNSGCRYEGRERRVYLRTVAPGVLELPRLVCAGCWLDMPTVTPWPPLTETENEPMAKITVHGGPTNAAADELEEGEDVSAGTSSSTSSEKDSSSPEQSEKPDRSPAPTTESRSGKGRTGSRSARGTGGGQAAGTSATDDK